MTTTENKAKRNKKSIIPTLIVLFLLVVLGITAYKYKSFWSKTESATPQANNESNVNLSNLVAAPNDLKANSSRQNSEKKITIPFSNLIALPPVNDIKADKSGKIWIATENGVYKYENTELFSYTTQNGKYPFKQAECIEIENNNILVGSLYGVSALNHNKKFINKTQEYNLPSEIVWQILWDGSNLWFSTQKGIAFKSENKPTITINSQNTNNGLRNDWCTRLARFSNWLGVSNDNGLSLWYLDMQAANPNSWKNLDKTKSIISRPIKDIVFDGRKLWLATPTGLMLISTTLDRFFSNFSNDLVTFTELNGLPSNSINSMVFHKNSIWLGTSKGLARIKINSNQIQKIAPLTGESEEVIRKLSLQDDILWIGTNKGVQFINTTMVD